MKNKCYYLSTCSTCKQIMKEVNIGADESFELQDVKKTAVSESDLDKMAKMSGSYESLFNRRSQKYRSMNLKEKQLSEADYKSLMLSEYTFLKRPTFVTKDKIFVGNSKKTVAAFKAWQNNQKVILRSLR